MKQLTNLAKGPQGRKLVKQARQLDTPENREKAKSTLDRLRGKKDENPPTTPARPPSPTKQTPEGQ